MKPFVILKLKDEINYLITILAKVVSGGFQDGQIQLRHSVWSDRRVALGQVVHQHAPPFEAQHALVALVDESVVVRRGNLQNKMSIIRIGGSDGDSPWVQIFC
jgi:hypothetical protein